MEIDQQQIEIISLMMRLESRLSDLYAIYAANFPEMNSFWSELSGEERNHANRLDILKNQIQSHKVFINRGRFKPQAVNFFLKNLDGMTLKAEEENDIVAALANAYDMESSLLENRYFEVFAADSAEIKEVLIDLERETKRHFEKVKEKLRLARENKK